MTHIDGLLSKMDMQVEKRFADWLGAKLAQQKVRLRIRRSKRVSVGVEADLTGINETVQLYRWKASWINPDTEEILTSEDWESTKTSLSRLTELLKATLSSNQETDQDVFKLCRSVVAWGGDRNCNVGATQFLSRLTAEQRLRNYLIGAKDTLSLDLSGIRDLSSIGLMNSMMTKIHSLCADDGLPIYDSRVSAAIASFAEMYRREELKVSQLPMELLFPAVGGASPRRQISWLYPDAPRQRILQYGARDTTLRWCEAKIRLGRITRMTLEANPHLVPNENAITQRMRAVEAAFFMIGYDLSSLLAR